MQNTRKKHQFEETKWQDIAELESSSTAGSDYYLPARWEECLDTFNYLCQHKQVLMALVGSGGSGKTSFLQIYVNQLASSWHICQLDAQSAIDTDELLAIVSADFKLSQPEEANPDEQLESMLLGLQQHHQQYLLIIDNAHHLSTNTLRDLYYLSSHQPSARLHILLVGELSLQTRLENLATGKGKIHTISLPNLNLEETEEYLKHRLAKSGQPQSLPFSSNDIARLYRLSGGIPGRINRLSVRALQKAKEPITQAKPAKHKANKQAKLLGALLLMLGFGSTALWLSHQQTANSNTGSLSASHKSKESAQALPAAANSNQLTNNAQSAASAAAVSAGAALMPAAAEGVFDAGNPANPQTSAASTAVKPAANQKDALGTSTAATNSIIGSEIIPGTSAVTPNTSAELSINKAAASTNTLMSTSSAANQSTSSAASTPAQAIVGSNSTASTTASSLSTNTPFVAATTAQMHVNTAQSNGGNAAMQSKQGVQNSTANPSLLSTNPSAATMQTKTPSGLPAAGNSGPAASSASAGSSLSNTTSVGGITAGAGAAMLASESAQAGFLSDVFSTKKAPPIKHKNKPLTLADHKQMLLAAKPSEFSLQIMGSHNLDNIIKLMKNAGISSHAHYFHTYYQGKDWYVLTYGRYANRQAAQQAVNKLPPSIRSLNPWPRDFASIKAAIKAKPTTHATSAE